MKCEHCGQGIKNDFVLVREKATHHFCSQQCQNAFETLAKQDLLGFYQKLATSSSLAPVKQEHTDFLEFDTEAYADEYVTEANGICESFFFIEGITCMACIWVNEQIVVRQEGIVSISINYASSKAHIKYQKNKIKLSSIASLIASIGYKAHPYKPDLEASNLSLAKKAFLPKLWIAIFCSLNIMMIEVAKYSGLFTYLESDIRTVFHSAEFFLASICLFYSGQLFYKTAVAGIRHYFVNMDFLVLFSALLSYLYSIWVLVSREGETYFDSTVMILSFVLIGKYIQLSLSQKISSQAKQIYSVPSMVQVFENGAVVPKLARKVKQDEIIVIKQGQTIPLDGVIVEGGGAFDCSIVTGESAGVQKSLGDALLSGTVSMDADIKYKASKDFTSSFVSQIASMLESGMSHRSESGASQMQLGVEYLFARYFGLVVVALAVCTFGVWLASSGDISLSFIVAMSVIVIACPCALALSLPLGMSVSLYALFARQIVCKNAEALLKMSEASSLVLDKTGTLTNASLRVTNSVFGEKIDETIVKKLLQNNTHPVALGVKKHLRDTQESDLNITALQIVPSQGAVATLENNDIYHLGNERFLQHHGIDTASIQNISSSILAIGKNGTLLGYYELSDTLKHNAPAIVATLKQKYPLVAILSGDNKRATQQIADKLQVEYRANCLPKDKEEYIAKLQNKGIRTSAVIMVGDGVNDALALSKSDVAISFANENELSYQASDFIIFSSSLSNLLFLSEVGDKTHALVRQNIFFSLSYNIITIPLAMTGFISPLVAALCMSSSSLVVVLNALRVQRKLKKTATIIYKDTQ